MEIRPLARTDLARVRPLLDLLIKDCEHFSYPRFNKISDIYRELEYSIEFMATESLVVEENGNLEGLVTYFWDDDEKYVQITLLVIKNKDINIFNQITSNIKEKLKGFEINLSLAESAWINDVDSFRERALVAENSHVLEKRNISEKNDQSLDEKILKKEDFQSYRDFYDSFAKDMYYSSNNLYRDFDKFRIFVKRDDEDIKASLIVKIYGKRHCQAEIFAIFIKDVENYEETCDSLIKAMENALVDEFGKIQEIKYYLDVDKKIELKVATKNGFDKLDTYILYKL